eukprot:TRINITY_DN95304_c0_g1_i1.p1 TRINITY_DN95304_c0_g1~~TRINITY_DN95304_c0_g1_i1.p1  ORF type:complete len:657 (+),score=134.12 TRINITY_DN95304_c0_g1_i1:47-2017(+)
MAPERVNPRYANPTAVHNLAAIRQMFPFQGHIEQAEHRGITLKQLNRIRLFARGCCFHWWDSSPSDVSSTAGQTLTMEFLNTYHLTSWLIKPATKEHDCAFMELLSREKQVPRWFISHWWGESFESFIASVKRHAEVRLLGESSPFWVCAYANRQHSLTVEQACDPRESGFAKALQSSEGVLLLLNAESESSGAAAPFSRAWCLYEHFIALSVPGREATIKLDIATRHGKKAMVLTDGIAEGDKIIKVDTESHKAGDNAPESLWMVHAEDRHRHFPIELVKAGLDVELEQAKTTVPDDRTRILNHIAQQDQQLAAPETHERYTLVNQQLRASIALALWRRAVEAGCVAECRLPEVVEADPLRTNFALGLRKCENMDDAGLKSVAAGLQAAIETLHLDLAECQVGNAGLAALAERLPSAVKSLALLLSGTQVTCTGLARLAAKLPQAVESLTLDISDTQISDVGLGLLAMALPKSVRSISLHFGNCGGITDKGLAILAARLPADMTSLDINIVGTSISNSGLGAIAAQCPTAMSSFCCQCRNSATSLDVVESVDQLRAWQPSQADCVQQIIDGATRTVQMLTGLEPVVNACHAQDVSCGGCISAELLKRVVSQITDISSAETARAASVAEEFTKDGSVDYVEFLGRFAFTCEPSEQA